MAKTTKIPKRIAGVKVPKDLRRAGNALIEHAQSPEGRAMIGKGISAVAALALAARAQAAHAPAPASTGKPSANTETSDSTASKAGTGAASCPDPVGDAIGAAATMVMGRLFGTKPV